MTQPHPQPMEITSKQMARVYNAIDLKSVRSVMDEIRDIYTATHTPAAPAELLCDECNIIELEEKLTNLEQQIKDEREKVLLKYQNWVAKEAKMALNGETRALVVRLNSKLIKEIESLRGGA